MRKYILALAIALGVLSLGQTPTPAQADPLVCAALTPAVPAGYKQWQVIHKETIPLSGTLSFEMTMYADGNENLFKNAVVEYVRSTDSVLEQVHWATVQNRGNTVESNRLRLVVYKLDGESASCAATLDKVFVGVPLKLF